MDFFSFTKAYTSKLHKDTDTDRTVSYLLLWILWNSLSSCINKVAY
jgi:hypothetical protein